MQIQIITPEISVFEGEIDSIAVPGIQGKFHMLNMHAPVVSILTEGTIDIYTHNSNDATQSLSESKVVSASEGDSKIFNFEISGGVVEINQNKLILLVD